jgi:hypothetical protein
MGGAVVTYSVVDADGVVKAAGLLPVHSGYAKVDEVKELVCRTTQPPPRA